MKILEASSESLRRQGASVDLEPTSVGQMGDADSNEITPRRGHEKSNGNGRDGLKLSVVNKAGA